MAIDGIKILDSDSAYDVYNPIMEMYHIGEPINKINAEIAAFESAFAFSGLYHEIYITAYALAMWEIGELSDELLQRVRVVVSQGASALWNDVAPGAQKGRQQVLNKFLLKIEQPNLKAKKRKSHNTVAEHFFSPGDVLVAQFDDNSFGAVILVTVFQERKALYYAFAEILLITDTKPMLTDVLQSKVHARMNIGFDDIRIASHDSLHVYKHRLNKIGNTTIKANMMRLGSQPPEAKTFEEFSQKWNECDRRVKKKTRILAELLE